MERNETQELIASLEAYLHDLQDTGVVGLSSEAPLTEIRPAQKESFSTAPSVYPLQPHELTPLEAVRADLGDCHRCQLGDSRITLVFGAGSPQARLVFVGEAPGADEDQQGMPFVGEAGQLLTKIIEAMQFSRDEIYICNVLKCRPPKNRNPQHDEIEACHPFLLRQLKAIGPEVIVALGTFAAQTLLKSKEPISRLRGIFHDYHGIALMPTFHPAYLLRTPSMKREVWEDMQKVMKRLGKESPPTKK